MHIRRVLMGALPPMLAAVALLTLAAPAGAASFTPGDVVVYRVGDGVTQLIDTGSAVFLDEYAPDGTPVQSIALPTTASGPNKPLVASGTAESEGQLGLSLDGRFLLFTGYDSTLPGQGSLASASAAMVPRVVGRVKFDGSIDTSTALTDFSDGNNARAATSTNGTDIWVGGADGGVRYTSLGTSTSTQLSTDSKNIRYVAIFNGQLYMSTQKGNAVRIGTIGSGTPTTAGQSITNLPGLATSGTPDAFFFADLNGTAGVDTLYVADEVAGLQKFSLLNGKWFSNGTVGVGADAYRSVTGAVSGTTVTLYATRKGSSGGELVRLVDSSGFNGTLVGTPTLLVGTQANKALRGVALAPASAETSPGTPTPTPTATPHVATATAALTATSAPTATQLNTPTRTVTPGETTAPSPTDTDTPVPTMSAAQSPTTTPPQGSAFTPGDLVVYRIGDGAATLTDNGNAVFLDEYTTSGSLIQSLALPTTANGAQKQLIASNDVSEGLLARSTDAQYVLLTGYGTDLGGGTALASTSGTTVPRVVGRVGYDGTIDTSTALTDLSSSNNPRSATSTNGTDLWAGGASSSTGGVHYATLGATTSTQLFASIPKGVRQVNIFGGQLYFDSNATGFLNVSSVGSGTPTTGGQAATELSGLPDAAGNDGYVFVDLGDGHGLATLYVANDTMGQILKYSLVGGSWTAEGSIAAASVHGVTATVTGTTVQLYATGTTGTDGTLFAFTDSTAYAGTVSGSAVTLASAATNEAFRGIALAPVSSGSPPPSETPTAVVTATPPATATPSENTTAGPTAAATDTPPSTAVPTVTDTPVTAPVCVGDCDRSGSVSINELITGVSIALGNAPLDQCPVFACDGDQQVSVSCLIKAVNAALGGCPS